MLHYHPGSSRAYEIDIDLVAILPLSPKFTHDIVHVVAHR
jgi:hypothetical protein